MNVFVFALFGLIVGSFLNVLIIRHNTGKTLLGRSGCMSCQSQLTWKELIPIVSFLTLKGKCGSCKSAISWQYPVVEFFSAMFAVVAYLASGSLLEFVFIYLILLGLEFIFVYDLKHYIIPDSALVFLLLIGFLYKLLFSEINLISDALMPVVLFLPFYLLWKVSSGRWIGLGDGKLAYVLGFLFGTKVAGFGLLWAVFLGAIVGSLLIALSYAQTKFATRSLQFTIKSEIPFAPFIIIGVLAEQFFNLSDIWLAIFV